MPSAAAPREMESDKKRGRKDTIIALLVVAFVFVGAGGWFLKTTRPDFLSLKEKPQLEDRQNAVLQQSEQNKSAAPEASFEEGGGQTMQTPKPVANNNVANQNINHTNVSPEQASEPVSSAGVTVKGDSTKLDFSKPKKKNKGGILDKATSNKEDGNPQKEEIPHER